MASILPAKTNYNFYRNRIMREERKNIYLITTFLSAALLGSLLLAANDYATSQNRWGVKIDSKLITKGQSQSQLIINLEHEYGDDIPQDLVVRIHDENGVSRTEPIYSIDNRALKHNISRPGLQVKNVFLESRSDIKVKANGRLLQSTDQSSPSFAFMSTFIKYFFSVCRNLALLSTLTITFDLWMPLLIFIETFLCLGYWTHNAHEFTNLYKDIFSCKLDVFNIIRLSLTGQNDVSSNSYLAAYGLTDKFAINCAGQLSFLLVLIALTAIIKILSLFLKSEKLRLINSKLKPMWNGYLFWMTPKTLSLAGFGLRQINSSTGGAQIFHLLVSGVAIVIILVYFVLLIVQIRKISGKLEYIEESRLQIGLAGRLDYLKDFQFDCLQYSMLYYPSMHLGKLIMAHLCIGFACDFHYVQFGGVIAAHVMYMMIQISSSGYKSKRDKIIYPILDFLYVLFFLAFIGIGLVYGVGHLDLTKKLETIGFSLIFSMTLIYVLQTVIDIIGHIRFECDTSMAKGFDSRKELHTNSNESDGKSDEFGATKTTDKDYIKAEQQNSESVQSIIKEKKATLGSKIKKVKNGKLM